MGKKEKQLIDDLKGQVAAKQQEVDALKSQAAAKEQDLASANDKAKRKKLFARQRLTVRRGVQGGGQTLCAQHLAACRRGWSSVQKRCLTWLSSAAQRPSKERLHKAAKAALRRASNMT